MCATGPIIRHSLPNFRTVSVFGSLRNGSCSSVIRGPAPERGIHRGSICNGTSVLNGGIIPALSNVSDNIESLWAAELLTTRQLQNLSNLKIVLSFEVVNQFYDCMELAVFNCPQRGMNASRINIYRDTSFRPERVNESLGTIIKANHPLSNMSCDYLLKFYVNLPEVNSSTYLNIEFPSLTSDNYVFVGEVSFLTGAGDCEQWPPELIETTNYPHNSKCMLPNFRYGNAHKHSSILIIIFYIPGTTNLINHDNTTGNTTTPDFMLSISMIIAAVVAVLTSTLLITLGIISIVKVLVCLRNHKRKYDVNNIQCQGNSAYYKIKHEHRVKSIQCRESSAYEEIYEYEVKSVQCQENVACQEGNETEIVESFGTI